MSEPRFCCRQEDVGKPKAEVAAKRVMQRVPGVNVTVHVGMIQDKPSEFYEQFAVMILGLDSIEARRYMNGIACSFLGTLLSLLLSQSLLRCSASNPITRYDQRYLETGCQTPAYLPNTAACPSDSVFSSTACHLILRFTEFDEDGNVKPETIKPMVDGGTEGLRGHARVIYPGITPCFECTLWLFPPQVKFPLCTLAETPRSPAHCIEYAHLILWGKVRDEEFDSDNEEHMQWVCFPCNRQGSGSRL